VIVATARTGLGKSWKGAFNMTYGATLGAHAVHHAVARAGIDPAEVEDVIMGSTFGEGTTGGNIVCTPRARPAGEHCGPAPITQPRANTCPRREAHRDRGRHDHGGGT
jgi:hypothetical protein